MRTALPILVIALAACGGDSSGPSVSATMSATISNQAWTAGGGGGFSPPSATYYNQTAELVIHGIGRRPGGDGSQQVTITIATNPSDAIYGIGDSTTGSHARVIVQVGNLLDTTSFSESYFTNTNASGLATLALLDLQSRHTTGSFHFEMEGGRVNHIIDVTAGSWDLPVTLVAGTP